MTLAVPLIGFGDGHQKTLVSLPESGPLKGQKVYSDSYAVFVGIAKFQNPGIPAIPCAVNDARTMRDILVKKYGFNPDKNHLTILANEQATKANIDEAIANLCDQRKIKASDRVLVYFSCHGQEVPNPHGGGKGYLIPYDAKIDLGDVSNPPMYQRSCIEMESIGANLESCPARHRTLIVDACFSGFALGSKGLGDGINLTDQTIRRLLHEPGLSIMTAGTQHDRVRGDGSENGLSAFTKALKDTLIRGEIRGATFSASQLYATAKARTTNATNGRQVPGFGMRDGTGEMLFFPVATQLNQITDKQDEDQVTDVHGNSKPGPDSHDGREKDSSKRQLAVLVDCVSDQTSGDSVSSEVRSELIKRGFPVLGPEKSQVVDKIRTGPSDPESLESQSAFKNCLVLKGTLVVKMEPLTQSGIALKRASLRLPMRLYDIRGNLLTELQGGPQGEPAIGFGGTETSAMASAIASLVKAIAIEFDSMIKSMPSPWNP